MRESIEFSLEEIELLCKIFTRRIKKEKEALHRLNLIEAKLLIQRP
jgi:hypothetical protein